MTVSIEIGAAYLLAMASGASERAELDSTTRPPSRPLGSASHTRIDGRRIAQAPLSTSEPPNAAVRTELTESGSGQDRLRRCCRRLGRAKDLPAPETRTWGGACIAGSSRAHGGARPATKRVEWGPAHDAVTQLQKRKLAAPYGLEQSRVVSPELDLDPLVARAANRDQILERIRADVVPAEQNERADVMHIKRPLRCCAARSASVAIAIASQSALPSPVRPTVVLASANPQRVTFAGVGLLPELCVLSAAKRLAERSPAGGEGWLSEVSDAAVGAPAFHTIARSLETTATTGVLSTLGAAVGQSALAMGAFAAPPVRREGALAVGTVELGHEDASYHGRETVDDYRRALVQCADLFA